MNQRPQNDHLRVNKSGKNIRKSIFHQPNGNANPISQPQLQLQPLTQVYIINKNDFKRVVQQLTSYESCESLPQNVSKRSPINRTSSPIPPNDIPVQEDPDVSLYMRYLQSLLEDSSGSNEDQFQQPPQAHSQPQHAEQTMSYSNDLEPVMTTTSPSPWWFDGSDQQMNVDYSLESTRVQYPPHPLTPNFTFSSMTQHGVFEPDLEYP